MDTDLARNPANGRALIEVVADPVTRPFMYWFFMPLRRRCDDLPGGPEKRCAPGARTPQIQMLAGVLTHTGGHLILKGILHAQERAEQDPSEDQVLRDCQRWKTPPFELLQRLPHAFGLASTEGSVQHLGCVDGPTHPPGTDVILRHSRVAESLRRYSTSTRVVQGMSHGEEIQHSARQ
jgi:hypothetical protein